MWAGPSWADDAEHDACTPAALVRQATRYDIPAIAQVIRAAYQEYAPVLGPLYPGYLADLLAVDRRFAEGTVLVAEVDGASPAPPPSTPTPAGRSRLAPQAGPRGGRWRSTRPSAAKASPGRWSGPSSARAMRAGADELCLHTGEFMTAAVALYEAHGFQRDPAYDLDATGHLDISGRRAGDHDRLPAAPHRRPSRHRAPAPPRATPRPRGRPAATALRSSRPSGSPGGDHHVPHPGIPLRRRPGPPPRRGPGRPPGPCRRNGRTLSRRARRRRAPR